MELLLRVNFFAVGRNGVLDIYRQEDGKYFAKVISWDQYQAHAPDDFIFWRTKRPYKAAEYKSDHWDGDLVKFIGERVEEWEFEQRWKEKQGKKP